MFSFWGFAAIEKSVSSFRFVRHTLCCAKNLSPKIVHSVYEPVGGLKWLASCQRDGAIRTLSLLHDKSRLVRATGTAQLCRNGAATARPSTVRLAQCGEFGPGLLRVVLLLPSTWNFLQRDKRTREKPAWLCSLC